MSCDFKKIGYRIDHGEGVKGVGLSVRSIEGPGANSVDVDFVPGRDRGLARSKQSILTGGSFHLLADLAVGNVGLDFGMEFWMVEMA